MKAPFAFLALCLIFFLLQLDRPACSRKIRALRNITRGLNLAKRIFPQPISQNIAISKKHRKRSKDVKGFRWNLLKKTYLNKTVWRCPILYDRTFVIPDQVDSLKYVKNVKIHSKVNITTDLQGKNLIILVNLTIPLFTLHYKSELKDSFTRRVNALAGKTFANDTALFRAFIRHYGTHYLPSVTIGSSILFWVQYDGNLITADSIPLLAQSFTGRLKHRLFRERVNFRNFGNFSHARWKLNYFGPRRSIGLRGFIQESQKKNVLLSGNLTRISALMSASNQTAIRGQVDLAINETLLRNELSAIKSHLWTYRSIGNAKQIRKEIKDALKTAKMIDKATVDKYTAEWAKVKKAAEDARDKATSASLKENMVKIEAKVQGNVDDLIRDYYAVYGLPK